ncbi:unnamed protein product [Amoebophrya sp. A25]|nr:unnamed protein product [Amoebophrya sp. A25]|eukprot:GSA25T00014211001.1
MSRGDLDESIFTAGMDPSRFQSGTYDDLDDLDGQPDPKRLKRFQQGGSSSSTGGRVVSNGNGHSAVTGERVVQQDEDMDEEGDDDSSSSSEEDLLDRINADAIGGTDSFKSKKPGIRGKRGAAARKRRTLQRLERLRQEADQENELQKFVYDPVITKHRNSKRVFITNVSFATSEDELKKLFEEKCGEIQEIRMSQDKATEKFSGYCHIQFKEVRSARAAIKEFAGYKLNDRYLYVEQCEQQGEKKIEVPFYSLPSTLANRVHLVQKHPQFSFPDRIQQQMVELHKEKDYAGKNISCLKTAWEMTHNDGDKLEVAEWGFKNFSSAFRTFPYFRMEREAPFLKPQPKISKPETSPSSVANSAKSEADSTATKEDVAPAGTKVGDGVAKGEASDVAPPKSRARKEKETIKQHKGSLTYVSYLR